MRRSDAETPVLNTQPQKPAYFNTLIVLTLFFSIGSFALNLLPENTKRTDLYNYIFTGHRSMAVLPDCRKLVSVHWMEDRNTLWYVTRAFRSGETPEDLEYAPDLGFGERRGALIIRESCPTPP